MKIIIPLVFIFLFSCKLNDKESRPIKSKSPVKQDIYPSFVDDYMKESLVGWQLVSLNEWKKLKKNKSANDSFLRSFILADINCDNQVDFTGILKDTIGNIMLYQIRSIKQYYTGSELNPNEKYKNPEFGLRLLNPNVPYKDNSGDTETFKCGAIESCNFNDQNVTTFYANENGLFVKYVGK